MKMWYHKGYTWSRGSRRCPSHWVCWPYYGWWSSSSEYRIVRIVKKKPPPLTCSNKDSKFLHFASQNSISVLGPGCFPSSSSWSLSWLSTSSTLTRLSGYKKTMKSPCLVRPFDDDALNTVFHQIVHIFTITLTNPSLLIIYVTCSTLYIFFIKKMESSCKH